MTNPEIQADKNTDTLEISIFEVVGFFKKYLPVLIAAAIISAIIGVAFSFLLAKKYTAQTILLPELGSSRNNSFFSMALGAGADPSGKLVPELYPNILSTVPFGQYLLKTPVVDQNDVFYPTLESYLTRKSSKSFLSGLFSFGKTSKEETKPKVPNPKIKILSFDPKQEKMVMAAKNLVHATVGTTDGIITIESEMTDPVVAAMLVDAGEKYLINYVSNYTISKTTQQVEFLQKRVAEARRRQQKAEYALQTYRDTHRNTFLNVARIEEQRLQAEYVLSEAIHSDLSIKLEQSKIREKEEKPVFKVLEPVRVPLAKSSPKRPFIGVIFSVLGLFLTLTYIIFFKEKLHKQLV
ncbi:Wzz/FepE/Etk N-terminal domain-containing protein [Dyadobacter sediminis]|uniref:Lipopolysaccharide biosynthesis protein n=1 Tax=Dyadobacter sediminis TaxID=1493691 RepID=A0A5R9K9D7_9BACT|nr:Wzz/FepE/Etk N-terminal domain-containing protein [Dyadobacter sediminis]TLU90645.1 lipopolysaccharide biosynthesis protein [Dyadobacter sediminis]GGC09551.1 chain-length determining protein [Dyadobacter sediminis]